MQQTVRIAGYKSFKRKTPSKPAGISEKVIRLLDVYTMIAQNKFPTVALLMDHFSAAERTIYRYLELINLIDPIELDRDRCGYRFTNGDRIKKTRLSEQELLILLATSEAVAHLGKPFEEKFRGLIDKMMALATGLPLSPEVPIIVKMARAVGTEKLSKHFNVIAACVSEKRSFEMTYRAQHNKETTTRLIDPYGLVFYEGVWILVAYCHLRKTVRNFAIDRILDVKDRNRYFTLLDGFSLKDNLSQRWGILDGEEVTVKVKFAPQVAEYALRRTWHKSEKKAALPDGSVACTYTVAGAAEIKKWLYTWLPYVEVLAPRWLRKEIHDELSVSSRTHS
jgi:predicted DNA-binding transcriptional regulator YafY